MDLFSDFACGCRVCTIHQPSSDVFRLFDKLLLLADGRVACKFPAQLSTIACGCHIFFNRSLVMTDFGPVAGVSEYFAGLKYPAPPHTNPADHFMRVLVDPSKPELAQATRLAICDHAASLPAQTPVEVKAGVTGAAVRHHAMQYIPRLTGLL